MADKYTWDDIIINPNDPRLEGAIGKYVFYGEYPLSALRNANDDKSDLSLKLIGADKDYVLPFCIDKEDVEDNENLNDFWPCIILKKDQPQKSYEERQAEWIKANDIKVGDKVMVTRKAVNCEDGWGNSWVMDKYVGKIITITGFSGCAGIRCGDYAFPYFVIEKVTPKYVPFDLSKEEDRDILRDKWLIKLYCGNFAKEECKVVGFSENSAVLSSAYDDGYGHQTRCFTGMELLNGFTFLDGTPCGKEVWE